MLEGSYIDAPHFLSLPFSQTFVTYTLELPCHPLSGLRQTECLQLRIKDLDFQQSQIMVRSGKGGKDRITPMPKKVIEPLQEHLRLYRCMAAANNGKAVRFHWPTAPLFWTAMPTYQGKELPGRTR